MVSAYLLVTHGSRDPRPGQVMESLVDELQGLNLVSFVGIAELECATEPLYLQIIDFAEYAWSLGYQHIVISPVFLLAGVHVMEDIPTQVAIAKTKLSSEIKIDIKSHLGAYSELKSYIQAQCQKLNLGDISWQLILLAHGSRRVGGNIMVENLATSINALTAYWSIDPNLESRLVKLNGQNYSHAMVIPYFLFTGRISDAIAELIQVSKLRFPKMNIYQLQPLATSKDFVTLIGDWLRS